ncbi:MAG: T9SS type A sorting domain-containing protein, partial [Prevotellaceae bacterium]|nr:T9SS type A sorting domain-containing protein [Prevotellaceae bacterium]
VSSSEKITGLTLYDISGRIQYQLKESGKYLEKVSNLNLQGIFVLKVVAEGQTKSYKILL